MNQILAQRNENEKADVNALISQTVSLLFDLFSGDPTKAITQLLEHHINKIYCSVMGQPTNPQELSNPVVEAL